jgi:hypothetical protein
MKRRMLIVAIASWKPDKDDAMWDALTNRKIPLSDDVKIVEYYNLPGRHKAIAIFDVPDETAIARSALNWTEIANIEYIPAITAKEYMKMRKEVL